MSHGEDVGPRLVAQEMVFIYLFMCRYIYVCMYVHVCVLCKYIVEMSFGEEIGPRLVAQQKVC